MEVREQSSVALVGWGEGKAAAQHESARPYPCSLHPERLDHLHKGKRPPQGCSEPIRVVPCRETEVEREAPVICPVVVVEGLSCLLSRGEGSGCIYFLVVLHLSGSIALKKETEEGVS